MEQSAQKSQGQEITAEGTISRSAGFFMTIIKFIVGWFGMILFFVVFMPFQLILLPFRTLRVRLANIFAQSFAGFILWLIGSKVFIEGKENIAPDQSVIYISNHTSITDILIAMWKAPIGTCAVAKKEVAYIPLFGQIYALSGSLLIDRKRSQKARASLQKQGAWIKKNKFSIFIWPEGTRSRTGRLIPFKKGFVHLAIQTELPIVPVVISGAHKSWQAGATLGQEPINVKFLPPIDTSHWTTENIEEAVEEVRAIYLEHLPQDQLPLKEDK